MARVVQRRSSPPYLLIVFVMLFVAATVLAVIFRNQHSKEADARRAIQAKCNKAVARQKELEDKAVLPLCEKVTGQKGLQDYTVALRAIDGVADLDNVDPNDGVKGPPPRLIAGLVEVAGKLSRKVSVLNTDIGKRDTAAQDHAAQLAAKDDTIKKLETQYKAELAKANAKVGELQRQVTAAVTAKENQMKTAVAEARKQVDDRDKTITLKSQEISNLNKEIMTLKGKIGIYEAEHRQRKPKVEAADPLAKVDGKVAKVLPEQGLCYIDLGRKDGVRRGLPFVVYPARAVITEKDAGKARIIVVSVHENTSECRIVVSKRDDPVIEGDLIANVAFDSTRVHKFAVEGDFDLYGRGRADPLGNSRIRQMIQLWGAEVVDTITVDTDFVIMGVEPAAPAKPAADAPAQEWEVYRQEMKKYQRFRDVQQAANRLHVQILNTTRFLAYSGVVPKTGVVE